MKLTAILLTVAFLHVKADGLSQTVTISGKKILLEKVFTTIKQQTGYIFFYTADIIGDAPKVSIHVKNASVEEVLKLALKNQQLSYHIENKTIIISKRKGGDDKQPNNHEVTPPPVEVKGKVLNHKGEPLAGANIKVKGTVIGSVTNAQGVFELKGVEEDATIEISYLGFESQTIKLEGRTSIDVQLKLVESELAAVSVSVYTGYQQIPKDRATGSFVQIDNKLLNRGTSLDVLSRMEGVASGVAFYRSSKIDQPTLNIRGRSTIFAEVQPLIVLDNFPYDGDITNINPNTIESITVLRDAAAASIYGVRAANGVIVLTSKKGNANLPTQTQFNTNVTIGERPDLGYLPLASSEDYIEVERQFFSNKWYAAQEASLFKTPLTPVAELLIKQRDGLISLDEANQQIEALKQNNYKDQYAKHFLRNSVIAQNALTVSGGGNSSKYFVAISYDKDQSSYVRNSFDRFSINASNQYTPFKNFDVYANLLYTNTKFANNNPGINDLVYTATKRIYPYAQVVDEYGYPASVNFGYRAPYKALKESQGFLDWQYRPLEELNLANNVTRQNYNRASLEIKKTFSSSFNIEVKYQYEKQYRKTENLMAQETYFVRSLINQYYNPTGTIKYPVPVGDILDQTVAELDGHTGRVQLNFNQVWQKHRVNMIGGYEVKQLETKSNLSRLYGYDDDIAISQAIDYVTRFPTNPNPSTLAAVPYPRDATGFLDRFQSYYANGSYTYNDKYVFSASGRLDNTNFFGVKANQRLLPLWSAGFKWNVSREEFFRTDLFEQLALRATYGYNGNINNDLTAYTTVRFGTDAITKSTLAQVQNPPNPYLRWEKVSMVNLGVVFTLKKNILSGSIEYFSKKGTDLIGEATVDPTTGITSFKGNMANIKGNGVDLQLTGKIIKSRLLGWTTNFLFSYATDKVVEYQRTFTAGGLTTQGSGDQANLAPKNGRPVLSIYSYAWGGLDPANGDPLGYVDGQQSKNYSQISSSTTLADLIYNGPVNPPVVGAFRNDFSWKHLNVSVNITYKMGHYFRRPSVDYGMMLNVWSTNADLGKRWQKPGDEATTFVPSIPTTTAAPTVASARERSFYANSEILVQKADHIRLQDIVISYDFDRGQWARLPIKKIHVYCNVNNIGILWRANEYGIDPDALPNTFANFLPAARSMTLGAKFDL